VIGTNSKRDCTVTKLPVLLSPSLFFPAPSYLKKLSFLQLGVLLDRRVLSFVLPVFFFIVLYSKLPHKVTHSMYYDYYYYYYFGFCFIHFLLIKKAYLIPSHFMMQELRFIISSVPIFNLSAAIAANRMYVAEY